MPQGSSRMTHRSKGMYKGSETQKECFDTIEIKLLTCDTCTLSVRMTKLTSSLPSVTEGFWIIWKIDRPVDKRRDERKRGKA